MKIKRHRINARPHVLITITDDGQHEDWAGPHLKGAVVKFEVISDAVVDVQRLRELAIEAGAVHVYPIAQRKPSAHAEAQDREVVPHDPDEALRAYAKVDQPPPDIDPGEMLRCLI